MKFINLLVILLSLLFIQNVNSQDWVRISTQEAIEDLDFMINAAESIHPNPFKSFSKKDIQAKKDSLVNTWPKIDQIPLRLSIVTAMKLSAFIEGGNTSVEWQNPKLFPELGINGFIPFKIKKKGRKIVAAYTATPEIKRGVEIKNINGKDIKTLYADILTYTGAPDSYKDVFAENFFPLYMFLNGFQAPYLVEFQNGEIGYIGTGLNIVDASLLLTSHLPIEEYTLKFHKDEIALLSINNPSNIDSFSLFLEESFSSIASKGIDNLMVDIRKYGGINPEINDLVISYLTKKKYKQSSGRFWKVSENMKQKMKDSIYIAAFGQDFSNTFQNSSDQSIIKKYNKKKKKPLKRKTRFEGQSCFLIGPYTVGSGMQLADLIKTYNLGEIVGSPTGEMTNSYGELIEVTMPNTGTYFFIPTTFNIGLSGDENVKSPVMPDHNAKGKEIEFAKDLLLNN